LLPRELALVLGVEHQLADALHVRFARRATGTGNREDFFLDTVLCERVPESGVREPEPRQRGGRTGSLHPPAATGTTTKCAGGERRCHDVHPFDLPSPSLEPDG